MTPHKTPRWIYAAFPLTLIPTAFMIWVAVVIGVWYVGAIYVVSMAALVLWGRRLRRPLVTDLTAPALTTVRLRPASVRIDVTGLSTVTRLLVGRPWIEIPLSRITGVHVDDQVTRRPPGVSGMSVAWIGRKLVIGTFLTFSGPSVKSWYAFRRGRPALVIDFSSNDIHEAVADVDDPAAIAEAINAARAKLSGTPRPAGPGLAGGPGNRCAEG